MLQPRRAKAIDSVAVEIPLPGRQLVVTKAVLAHCLLAADLLGADRQHDFGLPAKCVANHYSSARSARQSTESKRWRISPSAASASWVSGAKASRRLAWISRCASWKSHSRASRKSFSSRAIFWLISASISSVATRPDGGLLIMIVSGHIGDITGGP